MQNTVTALKRISLPATGILFLLLTFTACKKEPPTTPSETAEGSLQDSHGDCMAANSFGEFFTGIKSDTSYVQIGVNVTKKGTYHIITDIQNGVQFSADGTFTDTGYTQVHLKPSGLFTSPGQFNYVTAFKTSACHMAVRVIDSTYRDQADNTWEFAIGDKVYKGKGGVAYYHLPTYAADTYVWYGSLEGRTDTSLIVTYLPFESWDTAFINHLTSGWANQVHFSTAAFAGDSAVTFDANSSTAPAAVITIIASPYSRVVTFDGTAKDAKGNVLTITKARYRAVGENYIDLE